MKIMHQFCILVLILSTVSCVKDYSCGPGVKSTETWTVRNELEQPVEIKAYGIGRIGHSEFIFEVQNGQRYDLGQFSLASCDSLDVLFNNGKIARLYTYTAPATCYHINSWCSVGKDNHYCFTVNSILELMAE